MQLLGAFVAFIFLALKMATSTDVSQTGLITDFNYNKIMRSFPRHNKSELLYIRSKLQSLNSNVVSKLAARPAPTYIRKHTKYDKLPGTPQSIADINQLSGIGDFLYQSDLILTRPQLNDLTATARKKRKATSNNALKWPTKGNGVIPYFFDASLTPTKIAAINSAIQFWQTNACVQFELNGTGANSLQFFNGRGCYSNIGMTGGQQHISIGDGCECVSNMFIKLGHVTHEIGHALGFYHEQSRYDRDSYITIHRSNIQPSKAHNYAEAKPAHMNLYNVSYDYGSVMHYSSEDFALDPTIPVMVATIPEYQQTMGQRRAPSFKDILTMNRLYGCTGKALCASSTTVCKNGGYPDPNNCSQCKCPASFGGILCDTLTPAENGNCGASLTATTAWKNFSATVGTTNQKDIPTTCYWQLHSPPGTIIQVQLNITGGSCTPGCFWNSVELKLDSDYTSTGMRFCCAVDLTTTPYNSTTNLVPIIAYGSYETVFTIQYQYIVAVIKGANPPTTLTTTVSNNRCPAAATIIPPKPLTNTTTNTTQPTATTRKVSTILTTIAEQRCASTAIRTLIGPWFGFLSASVFTKSMFSR